MTTGSSSLLYPEQAKPEYPIEPDDSYFLVRLHEAQAYFEAGWLSKPGYLIFSTSVTSTFQPDSVMHSLHRISSIKNNSPCRLGVNINLTDWLPARSTDSLHIVFRFLLVQDTPLKDLMDRISSLGLTAALSVARPDLAAAIKVSEIAGRLLSAAVEEGKTTEILNLDADLPVTGLSAGYHAVIGTREDRDWPKQLRVREAGNTVSLAGRNGCDIDNLSYVLMEMLLLKRRGEEAARREPWWDLLQEGRERAMNTFPEDDRSRRKAWDEWRATLLNASTLARKEKGCLVKEIREMLCKADLEVREALMPPTMREGLTEEEIPDKIRDALGVRNLHDMESTVRNYRQAVDLSRDILKRYREVDAP